MKKKLQAAVRNSSEAGKNLGSLNKGVPIPLYYQINDIILRKIEAGDLRSHQQLPSEDELSSIFEVSRMTVRQAVIKLVNEGKLYRQRGQGTFVAEPKIERKVAGFSSFNKDMEARGLKPGSVILQKKAVKPGKEIRYILNLQAEEKVMEIIRLRLANGQTIGIGKAVIPVKVCRSLLEENLEDGVSLIQFMEEKGGCKIAYGEQKIQAVQADSYQAKLLKIEKGSPLLHLNIVFYSNGQAPIGIFETFYRGDRYVFTSTVYR